MSPFKKSKEDSLLMITKLRNKISGNFDNFQFIIRGSYLWSRLVPFTKMLDQDWSLSGKNGRSGLVAMVYVVATRGKLLKGTSREQTFLQKRPVAMKHFCERDQSRSQITTSNYILIYLTPIVSVHGKSEILFEKLNSSQIGDWRKGKRGTSRLSVFPHPPSSPMNASSCFTSKKQN